jgi:predicted ArsR family transcriptional regulator
MKEKILQYLSKGNSASVSELALVLDRSKADIRYNLAIMSRENMILTLSPEKHPGAGRPAAQFKLQSNPPVKLTKLLIQTLLKQVNPSINQNLTRKELISKIVEDLVEDFSPSGSKQKQINQAIQHLESLGVKAKWEATKPGPKIILQTECISDIIDDSDLSKMIIKQTINRLLEKTA